MQIIAFYFHFAHHYFFRSAFVVYSVLGNEPQDISGTGFLDLTRYIKLYQWL